MTLLQRLLVERDEEVRRGWAVSGFTRADSWYLGRPRPANAERILMAHSRGA